VSVSEPHDVECRQILTEVYLFLDLECSDERRTLIQNHLDECRDCLREYGIEHEVKLLVGRCCGSDRAPQELRERVRSKIAALVVDTQATREAG
jgi:mycothiol system anti-sigma-R factor